MVNDSIVPDIGVLLCQGRQQLIQSLVLEVGIGLVITALEFNTDTEIIALLASLPAGDTRVPGPHVSGDKLHHFAGAPNQKMGRYL